MNDHQRVQARHAGKPAGYTGFTERVSRMARSESEKKVDEDFERQNRALDRKAQPQRPEMILGPERMDRMRAEEIKALAPGFKHGGKVRAR